MSVTLESITTLAMSCSSSSASSSSLTSEEDEQDLHGNSWNRRSLIEDAKFDTITNAEFEKHERNSVSTTTDVMDQNEENFESADNVFPVTNGDAHVITESDTLRKCTVMMSLRDNTALSRLFKHFENGRALIQHVETRRSPKNATALELLVTFETSRDNVLVVVKSLKTLSTVQDVSILNENEAVEHEEWFPKHVTDLDNCQHLLTKYDPDLASDHPGFIDLAYRERRKSIAEIAFSYRTGEKIPRVQYTNEEIQCWGTVYRTLSDLYLKHACKEHLENFRILENECGYSDLCVPQLEDVSNFLQRKSGFRLRPVAGLLSARDFLASLAFRVFQCTQYTRHPSKPDHTVEPDCIHELLGHIPMLANPNFAQFSQEIGLASLGASDEDIEKFATIYWFTVEFGLCRQNGEIKAYGAGLLSAYGELLHAISDKPEKRVFEPAKVAVQKYDDQNYQEVYFICDSFADMKEKVRTYASSIKRPYTVRYDPYTQCIQVINNKEIIQDISRVIKGELNCLHSALARIESLTLSKAGY